MRIRKTSRFKILPEKKKLSSARKNRLRHYLAVRLSFFLLTLATLRLFWTECPHVKLI